MIRKNSLITAAAIAGVLFAGTTAVAANVGLLTPSDTGSTVEASAATQVTTASSVDPQIVDVYIEDPSVTVESTTTVPSLSQVFGVEAAGTVSVEPTPSGVRLDGVTVADGWQWTATQPSPNELHVTFTSADVTYVFSAGLAPDGTIVAGVDQPIVQVAPAPAASSGSTTSAVRAAAPAAPAPVPSTGHGDDHGEHDGGESDD
jgi:hypothetical protein